MLFTSKCTQRQKVRLYATGCTLVLIVQIVFYAHVFRWSEGLVDWICGNIAPEVRLDSNLKGGISNSYPRVFSLRICRL